jgi:predicted nucleic acid-binding Zn ribbon protein
MTLRTIIGDYYMRFPRLLRRVGIDMVVPRRSETNDALRLLLMTEHRKNRKSFAPIGEVIDKVLRQCRPQQDQSLIQVWEIWDRAVGATIAANARPVAVNGNVLLVHVASATWLHHIRFLEREMVAKLNAALGAERVKTIKLRVGDL